jgi:hypothetical protein
VNCLKITPGTGHVQGIDLDQVAGRRHRVWLGFAHGIGTGPEGAARSGNSRTRRFHQPALPLELSQNTPHHGSRNRLLLAAEKNRQFVLPPARKLPPQSQNLACYEKRPSRLAALPRTMTALLQRAQIVRIIAPLPAIERLAADAKVTAGVGDVAAATIEIHPGQPHPSFPAELHPGSRQSTRTRRFPSLNLHSDTLFECH